MSKLSSLFAAIAATVCLALAAGCTYAKVCRVCAWEPRTMSAIAIIHPTEGNAVRGVVRFSQEGESVRIVADVSGFRPDSKHAIHIHKYGDFSSPDAKSAGGHYNLESFKHGGPKDTMRHAGDLGNLVSNSEGNAHYELVVDNITIDGRKNPILGRGVVIHAGEDDFVSQSTGNAGPRIGLGIIGVANPKLIKE